MLRRTRHGLGGHNFVPSSMHMGYYSEYVLV
jgi:hypothetical protein